MLTFEGTAYERGLQHGAALSDAIHERIDVSLAHLVGAESRTAIATPWKAQFDAAASHALRELEGIAAGAEASVDDIVLLNSFEAFDLSEQIESGGCTTIAITGENGAIVGQNWDANEALAEGLDVHLHEDPDHGSMVLLASPGSLGWIGMNDRGLALCNNDLLTRTTRMELPSLAVRRRLLAESDVRSALRVLRRIPAVAGRSYTLGDAHGATAVAEVAAEAAGPAVRKGAPLSHANHAVMPPIMPYEDGDARLQVYPSSPGRLAQAETLIGAAHTREDVLRILTDHEGFPHSICRHDAPDEPTYTAATVIFDCAAAIAEFHLGLPCTTETIVKVML